MTRPDQQHGGENRYRALFENTADAILIIVGDKFVDCNQAAVDMLRARDKKQVLQTHPSELSPEYQSDGRLSFEKANELMAIALERGSHRFEWDHVRTDGEVFPVEVLLTAIPSDDGFELHTVWRDITERKKLETELRHSQKVETIGKLVGGIAHDFNNQLVPILGYVELLEEALQDRDDLLESVTSIRDAGVRAASLIKQLMVFSYKDTRKAEIIDLKATVEILLGMITTLIGEDIRLRYSGSGDALPVRINPGEIEQIVLNLATNARDAMPTGGEIELTVAEVTKQGSTFALLQVADSGTGMDDATLAQVFEPFFTTKEQGYGTGLGLSTLHSIVNQVNGSIDVITDPGKGSRFDIFLPCADGMVTSNPEQERTESPSPPPETEHAEVSGHILLAEDNEPVADFISGILRREGYKVTHAADGRQALSAIKNQDFDLILTDIIMPDMSGPEMIRALGKDDDIPPVVFMSGYTDDRLAAYGFNAADVSLLQKPFSYGELLSVVADALQ